MMDILNTLLISCVPALVTGFFAYFSARKTAQIKINELQKQNEHEINKLMEQHKIDIDSLKEKHALEMEKVESEHRYKLDIIALEHKNELESKEKELEAGAKYGAMGSLLSNPEKINGLLGLLDHPEIKKRMK
ncbi:MAG: hypothetical protein AAC990_00760 [Dehalococcoides mccartyi]|uniref:hypothetical protein n=1 Tax=Dehalococcoides mccartyi TaxID=61435 RepID=UPI0030F9FB15